MMQIVYFSQKEQFLTEMENFAGDKIFVTPSPAKADGLRSRLQAEAPHDVITIAKFTSQLVDFLWAGEAKPDVKRKAELLVIFGILKDKHLPELGYEQFTQAYNLFSDLRSFTLNTDALTSVLDEQPEIIRKAVLLFWKLLEVTGFHDEHSAYREITERLRTQDFLGELDKTYIFWGFQHLNGQQVDLLKALAIRYQVIIPFPLELKEKVKRSDWISWLQDSRTEEKTLVALDKLPKATWLPVNSRELALNLRNLLKPHDQVVLGVSKLGPLYLDLVPSQDVFFKIPVELLDSELMELFLSLQKFRGTHIDLLTHVSGELKKARTLKHFRAWQLYAEALSSVTDLTESSVAVDAFFLKVLNEVVRLNQPRTSYVPVSSCQMTIDLKDTSSLEYLDRKRRVLLCIDERFEDIQGLGQNYTESIQKSLAALGPLKRNELELLFRKWEFTDLFSRSEVIVLMNEGTLKHSLVWKRLFQDIDLLKLENKNRASEVSLRDHLKLFSSKSFSGNFSASKLQAFLDCPRSFYFSYVDQIFPDIKLEKDFDPMVSGTILHEIIEIYFKHEKNLSDISAITKQVMTGWMEKMKLSLAPEVLLQRELVFNHRALNGITFVQELARMAGETIDWKIEEPISLSEPYPLKGRIDCLGRGKKHLFLLDFKSSEYSASSGKEIAELEAIQLWTYAVAAQKLVDNFDSYNVTLGYVILDDPSKSILVSWDEDLFESLKAEKLCKLTKLKEDFPTKLHKASEKLVSLTLAITQERDFPARPRSKESCTYCDLNKVCVKSEIVHVQES